MRLKALGSVAAFMFLSSSLQLSAAPLVYTYMGTVSSGTDSTGVFGTPNKDLTGESYKVVETFDLANATYNYTDGSTYSQAYGGTDYGGAGFGTSQVTIGGLTATSSFGDYASYLYNAKSSYHEDQVVSYNNSNGEISTSFLAYSSSTPLSFTEGIPSGTINSNSGGSYYNYQYDGNGNITQAAYAAFTIDSLTVTNGVSSVPLPASAPMFGAALLAFGAVHYGMKRKAKAAT